MEYAIVDFHTLELPGYMIFWEWLDSPSIGIFKSFDPIACIHASRFLLCNNIPLDYVYPLMRCWPSGFFCSGAIMSSASVNLFLWRVRIELRASDLPGRCTELYFQHCEVPTQASVRTHISCSCQYTPRCGRWGYPSTSDLFRSPWTVSPNIWLIPTTMHKA